MAVQMNENIDMEEYQLLLTGISTKSLPNIENPNEKEFPEKIWNNVLHLSNLKAFSNLPSCFENEPKIWTEFILNIEITKNAPFPFNKISNFSYLLLVKTFRPDAFIIKVKEFIQMEIGKK